MSYKGESSVRYPWMHSNDGYTHASKQGAYNTSKWKKLRLWQLDREPLCRMCKDRGILTPANTVDHIIPVESAEDDLFFDTNNLQSLCSKCHRIKTNVDHGKNSTENRAKGRALMDDLES